MSKLPRRTRTKKQPDVDLSKIGKLLRLLGSDRPGEVVATAAALQRTLAAAGLDLHALADAVEAGLKPAPRRASWGPPVPDLGNWSSMAWYAHFHRHRLQRHSREFVEDTLLGRGFCDGQVTREQLARLRAVVASLRATE